MTQERPLRPRTGHRVLRSELPHGADRTTRPTAQHVRGERILRDGTRVPPRPARTRPPGRPPGRTGTVRMPLAPSPRRLHVVLIVVAMGLSLCGGRLLQLQGFDSAAYAQTSAEALTRTLPLLPARGELTDRNGAVLASTQPAVAVTADPTLTGPTAGQIAAVLSGYLQMTEAELIPLLTKPNTHFVYLKKKVPAMTYSALAADLARRDIYGIFRESDPLRTYPNGSTGAAVVGFVGSEGKGLAGLELSMNSELAGTEGKETFESAPNGSKIPLGQSSMTPAQNGLDYQLTLDTELQWMAERRVAEQVAKTGSDWGFAITMDVRTGEVLAMANAPTFDSSKPGAADKQDRGNRAISDPFEPGSVQKVLTAAALFDSGTATPDTKVTVPYRLPSDGLSIKDSFPHGNGFKLLFRGVIAKSSNIGTAVTTRQLSKKKLHDYLVSFGLGSPTGIELPGEAAGIVPDADMTDGRRDQIAFGQAISMTGIQEAAAIAGLVNGGIYHPPTVIKKATDSSGQEVVVDDRQPRRVISEESSAQVRDVMRAVIDSENGQKNLKMEAYQTGGKTGTAQRADASGRYKGYVTSYIGFAPVDDPQILTYVVMSNPRNGDSGSGTAAPVYKDIMNLALPRYSVPPNPKQAKPKPYTW